MTEQMPFDNEHQMLRTRACQEFLTAFLSQFGPGKSTLDVGCGVGLISQTLSDAGLGVTAVDARPENVAEAKRRYPHLDFRVGNAEDVVLRRIGRFDIVVCFGLMYHLENPFMAVRNLFEVANELLVIESIVAPGDSPMAVLNQLKGSRGSALRNIAFIPTESCLASMCYQAGFRRVYRPVRPPDNPYFRSSMFRRRQRTVLVAAKEMSRLNEDDLELVTEVRSAKDLWVRPLGTPRFAGLRSLAGQLLRATGLR